MVKPVCTGMAVAYLRGVIKTPKTVIEPRSSGYLFARFDSDRHYPAVSYATGVRGVVEFGSGRVELDATMIDPIKKRMNDDYVAPQSKRFKMGQIVHI